MTILGYVFTTLNYICFIISRFLEKKKWIVTLDVFAKIFTIAGLYCLNSLAGSYSMVVALVFLIVLNVKERKYPDRKWILVWAIFELALIAILILNFDGLASVLVFITSSITFFHTWFLPPQWMRLIGGYNCILFLCYQLIIKNWAGLLEILVMVSNFIAYYKYKKLENKKDN